MEEVRRTPPLTIGGKNVVAFRDYLKDIRRDMVTEEEKPTGLPKSNVLYFELENNSWCCIRPSGTEPKIKFYYGVKAQSEESAAEQLKELEEGLLSLVK